MLSKILALLLCTVLALAASAQSSADAIEQTFWQSTERIGTAEAYRAYLTRYPAGLFAPLAEAALSKTRATERAPAEAASAAVRSAPASRRDMLQPFAEPASSGAVTFQLGDEFVGPKAVTVGWLGARKQLVVPAGRWIVLAAEDAKAYPAGTTGVVMTSVVLGRFEGSRLVALTRYVFNAKVVPYTVAWGALEGCGAGSRVTYRSHVPSISSVRTECERMSFDAAPLRDASAVTARVSASLTALGASVHGPALVSSLSFSEKHRGLLRVVRYDWPGAAQGDAGQTGAAWRPEGLDAPREAFVSRLWTWWFDAYRGWAGEGYLNDISEGSEAFPEFAARPAGTAP